MTKPTQRREDQPMDVPNRDGNVWPVQSCPAFTPRGGALQNTCWYCVYADFHQDKPRTLDVGVCYYPKRCIGGGKHGEYDVY